MIATSGPDTRPLINIGSEQISQEELANAEDVLERGSKKKFGKLTTVVLRALCKTYLNRVDFEKMSRDAASSALHQYVGLHVVSAVT